MLDRSKLLLNSFISSKLVLLIISHFGPGEFQSRSVGSIKRLGGGHRLLGALRVLKRAPKQFFLEMLATGGGREKFSRRIIAKLHVFDQIFFKKIGNFYKKKGTFDVNLVFTATLACTKRALFITKKGTFHHKKGHFSSQKRALFITKKRGGAHALPPPPRFLRPCSRVPQEDLAVLFGRV